MFAVPAYAQQVQDWSTSGCMVDGVPTLKCFEVVFSNILVMASGLIVIVLFIMLVVGAFNYLTSLGNPEKLKKAQGTLRYAVIGLVIYLASFVILKVIDVLFLGGQGTLFKFSIGE
jgi:hypothetical protein